MASDSRWSPEGRAQLHFEVSELLTRAARAIDRKDYDLLREVFHKDAYDDHGLWSGSVDTFIEVFDARHEHIARAMHLNGNSLMLEVDPERREVLVETPCVAWSWLAPGASVPGGLFTGSEEDATLTCVANRYLDIVSERDGRLGLAFRRVIFEWADVPRTLPPELPFDPSWSQAVRSPADPSFTTLAEVRAEVEQLRAAGA